MPTQQLDPVVKLERDLVRAKSENALLKKYRKAVSTTGSGYEAFIEELSNVIKSEDKFTFSPEKIALPKGKDNRHVEIACCALSDLHLCETVRRDDSCGINEFNSMICANRLHEYAESIVSILSRHSNMYKFKSMWIPMLGDMISGSIHLDQQMYNDLSDPASVILGSRLVYMFLKKVGALGLPVTIDAIHGNHPRTTVKMPTKRQAATNLDWQLYEVVKDKLEGDTQFDMTITTSQIGMRKLFDWRYVFEHGIGVSNGGEEALEGRIRNMFDDPIYRAATGLTGTTFDQLLIGNTHRIQFLERSITNGNFVGQNELGVSWRLKPITASQAMWGVSQKRVKTWQYIADMTNVCSSKVENPFSEYTAWFMKRHRR